MGGSINIIIRFSDGTVRSIDGWTNPMPYWFTHMDLIRDPDTHLRKYLGIKDREEVPLAPIEYGTVVVDVVTKTIASMQGYTSFGDFDVTGLLNDITSVAVPEGRLLGQGAPPYDPTSTWFQDAGVLPRVKEFMDDGRVTHFKSFNLNGGKPLSFEEHYGEKMTFEGLYGHLYRLGTIDWGEARKDTLTFATLLVNMNPWTIVDFSEGLEACTALRQWLLDNGFNLTNADEAGWVEYRSRFDDEDEEDSAEADVDA